MRLIYISPVPWQSYAQRPHFMVEHFLANGGEKVIWLNPYPCRLPKWSDLSRRPGMFDQQTIARSNLEMLDVPALPIEPLPGSSVLHRRLFWNKIFRVIDKFSDGEECIVGVGKPCLLASQILAEIPCKMSFYDAMDDFPVFHQGLSERSMAAVERSIVARVDHLLVTSSTLARKFSSLGHASQLIPNAFDNRLFEQRRLDSTGSMLRLGYVGSMGHWFDWEVLSNLANHLPDSSIDLYGTVLKPPPTHLPENIQIHAPFRHDRITEVLARFDAGLIPFKKCRLTDGVDPVKYYEYRAMGLPVLSTSFGSMRERDDSDGVFFIDDPLMIESSLEKASSSKLDHLLLDQWSQGNTWKARFDSLDFFPVAVA